MSYPPYNPQGPGMYPSSQGPPSNYPGYPGSGDQQPPSGYPQSMPMPTNNYPPYPAQPQYPPQQAPCPYPANPTPSYPPQQYSAYPPQNNSPFPSGSPYPGATQPQHHSPYPSGPTPTSYPGAIQPPQHQNPTYPGAVPPPQHHYSTHSPGPTSSYPGATSSYPAGISNVHDGSKVQQSYKKGTPTVTPVVPFNPRGDAEILRKAMKGFGTDEKAIIAVLANRTNSQRQEIALQFKTLYGLDLIEELKSETSGNFKKLLVSLITPTSDFLAREIYDAIEGIGTDEETLIEILCTATNNEIHMIRNSYHKLFNRSLEKDLAGETSGAFKRLLVSLSQGNRNENYSIDHAAAQNDAQDLLRAGEIRLGTDESIFNAVLCSRSYPQLSQIMIAYFNLTGHDFKKAIDNEFSGDIKEGLLAIVKSVQDRSGYFAERLYNSMSGFGTKDRTLQRIVAVRSEIDMVEIKNSFMAKYGKSLEEYIKDDCSGDYKRILVALIT